jgi:hypothetical protein
LAARRIEGNCRYLGHPSYQHHYSEGENAYGFHHELYLLKVWMTTVPAIRLAFSNDVPSSKGGATRNR